MPFFDLIVVGAGVLGTFHAYHAARAGQRVLLLEKDNRPVGATVRNFGQVVPSGLAGRWFDYGRRSLAIYRQIQAETDISVRQNGSVYVASDEAEWALANELYEQRRAEEYPCALLTPAQTLARYPLRPDYVRGALFFPDELSVEPDRLINRLIDYVVKRFGATYRPNAAVIDCQANYSGAIVRLANGERFQARQVLVCNGHEFRLLFPDVFAESGLVVSKLQMLRTDPLPQVALPGNVLTGLTIRRYEAFRACPSYGRLPTPDHLAELQRWGIHLLFKQAVDGSVIVGDSHEYADAPQADNVGYDLNEHVTRLMLAEARRIVTFPVDRVARTWAGYYAQTDRDVFDYVVDDNIRVITGIGGKGMTSSAGYAEANVAAWLGQAVSTT